MHTETLIRLIPAHGKISLSVQGTLQRHTEPKECLAGVVRFSANLQISHVYGMAFTYFQDRTSAHASETVHVGATPCFYGSIALLRENFLRSVLTFDPVTYKFPLRWPLAVQTGGQYIIPIEVLRLKDGQKDLIARVRRILHVELPKWLTQATQTSPEPRVGRFNAPVLPYFQDLPLPFDPAQLMEILPCNGFEVREVRSSGLFMEIPTPIEISN